MKRAHLAGLLVLFGGAVVVTAGCAATVQGGTYAESDPPATFSDPPTLVEIDSGVWVVQDYDRPVYYVDDDYYVYRDGIWFRSHSYQGGWARVEPAAVPVTVVRRDQRAYVHYRGNAAAQTRVAPRREIEARHDRPGPGPEHHDPGPEHHDPGPGRPPEHHEVGQPEHHDGPGDHAAEHRDEHGPDPRGGPGHDNPAGRPDEHRAEPHHDAPPGPQRGGPPGPAPQPGKKHDRDKDKKH